MIDYHSLQDVAAQTEAIVKAEAIVFVFKLAFSILSGAVILISILLLGQSKSHRRLGEKVNLMHTALELVKQNNGHIDEKYDTIITRFDKLDIRIDELIQDK